MAEPEDAQRQARGEEIDADLSDVPASTGRDVFSTLPTELVLLIISFHPSIYYWKRRATLFSLSRTCQHLRAITLEETWRVFDTTFRYVPDVGKVSLESVIKQTKMFADLQHIHPLVKSVRVMLDYPPQDLLPVLMPCLAKLTNVTEMAMLDIDLPYSTPLREKLEGYQFPHVRELTIGPYGHDVLRRCTGVRSLTFKRRDLQDESDFKLFPALTAVGQGVEELHGFCLEGHDLKKLLPNVPNLRVLETIMLLGTLQNATTLELLASCKQLSHICVNSPGYREPNEDFLGAARKRYVVDTSRRTYRPR